MGLMNSISVSASGMAAQSARIQMLSENIANAGSLQSADGGPYRRKIATFEAYLDRNTGMTKVKLAKISKDMQTPLKAVYNPSHELANEKGFVMYPNVSTFIESTDMRSAARAYEANMSAIESAKDMMLKSIELLR